MEVSMTAFEACWLCLEPKRNEKALGNAVAHLDPGP